MILQVNQRGSWQNVLEFDEVQLPAIQSATLPLARAIAAHARLEERHAPSWRIAAQRAKAPKVLWLLEAPALIWRRRA